MVHITVNLDAFLNPFSKFWYTCINWTLMVPVQQNCWMIECYSYTALTHFYFTLFSSYLRYNTLFSEHSLFNWSGNWGEEVGNRTQWVWACIFLLAKTNWIAQPLWTHFHLHTQPTLQTHAPTTNSPIFMNPGIPALCCTLWITAPNTQPFYTPCPWPWPQTWFVLWNPIPQSGVMSEPDDKPPGFWSSVY